MPDIAALEERKRELNREYHAIRESRTRAERELRAERIDQAVTECRAVITGESAHLDVNNAIGAALYSNARGENIDGLVKRALEAAGYTRVHIRREGHVSIEINSPVVGRDDSPDTQQWSAGTIGEREPDRPMQRRDSAQEGS